MDMLLRLRGKELYPLMEIARLEKKEVSQLFDNILSQGLEEEVIRSYNKGEISLWKASELLDIPLWELVEKLEKKGTLPKISRVKS